jgi:hypothetical protein
MQTDLKDKGQKGVEWIHIVQDRNKRQGYVNMVMNLRVEDSSLLQCYAVLLGKRAPAYPTM